MKKAQKPRHRPPLAEAFSYDPAFKLFVLNLMEESQKNSYVSVELQRFIESYLGFCHKHEQELMSSLKSSG
jgi:hypothetical protein